MAAKLVRLRTRQDKLKAEEAAEVRQAVLGLENAAPRAVAELLTAIDRQTAADNGWVFVMLGPAQFIAVNRWLARNSKRPVLAMQLWPMLFDHLRYDTGEITIARKELAAELGCPANCVSEIMTELCRLNAVIRHREGNRVTYFVNPTVGTHLAGQERVKAQAKAPQLTLVV